MIKNLDNHFGIVASGQFLTETFPLDYEDYADHELQEWMEGKIPEDIENLGSVYVFELIFDLRNDLVDAYKLGMTHANSAVGRQHEIDAINDNLTDKEY